MKEECKNNVDFNARITDVRIKNDSLELIGVAFRSDFLEYRLYWLPANKPEQQVESGEVFIFNIPVSADNVLQSRSLNELAPKMAYRVVLRVLGTSNGQYQECIVRIELP